MGSAQSIWDRIKKKKLLKIFKGDSFSLFYKCQLRAFFFFLFILFAFLSLITSFHHLNGCYVPHYLSTFSSFYPPNFSYFISTVSLHFQMSLRLLRTAHTLKFACQPPALGEWGGRGGGMDFLLSSQLPNRCRQWWVNPSSFPSPHYLVIAHMPFTGKSTLTLALTVWTLPLTDGERKKPSHRGIRSTVSYIIILRFEQLVQQEISHMTPCLLFSKGASAWVLSTTTLSSSRSLDCQVSVGKNKYLPSVSLTVK